MSVRGSVCATAFVALLAGALTIGGAPATAATEPRDVGEMPDAQADDSQWQTWASEDRDEAASFDWAADSAARGCELIEIEITEEVDPVHNESLGAPADLATVRVDRVEECEPEAADRLATTESDSNAAPAASSCNSGTKGPGTICISSSGGWVNASWQYRGSGQVSGFLRVYQIPSTAGCPTGTTWLTSPTMTWNSGQTRTTSKSQTQSGAYSAHIWRSTALGNTNWGATCSVL